MREKIEWVEPAEAAREHRRHKASEELRALVCRSLLVLLGGTFASLWLATSATYLVALILLAMLSQMCALFFVSAVLHDRAQGESACVLDARGASSQSGTFASRCDWAKARSFEIADHPTRPGIRALTIHVEGKDEGTRFFFRQGQLDEAELRTFVEARIAEPTAQRLMRRVGL